ncbi:MAG: DUF4929 family protein [Capnocytophaga sp.]|nr:DUF4929 family protein [Capnocytophaga sp.]
MKKIKFSLKIAALAVLTFIGCSKDNDSQVQYSGENRVYITAEGDKSLTIGEADQKIEAKISLTTKVDTNTSLQLKVVDAQGQTSDLVSLSANPISIQKDGKEATFTITLAENKSVTEEQRLKVTFEPVTGLTAQEDLQIVVKPSLTIASLTTAQRQLLDAYKAKGMDLYPFMGKVKVTGSIFSPADGYDDFATEFTRPIEGNSIISLSETASDTPVLTMTENPMGLTEFWYYLLRKNTVENTAYFPLTEEEKEYASPVAQAISRLINWNASSQETLAVTLDNIKIGTPTNGVSQIEFIHKQTNKYDTEISVVPFQFTYSANERFKKLIAEGNAEALENDGQDGGPNPALYLNHTDILKDEYSGVGFKASSGTINFTEKKMTFEFLISHEKGGGYINVKVEYQAL